MGGQVLFQDALAARLNIIQPSRSDLTKYLAERDQIAAEAEAKANSANSAIAATSSSVVDGGSVATTAAAATTTTVGSSSCLRIPHARLTPGVKELIDRLHAKGKIVYLVSGGFRQVITHVNI